MRSLSKNRDQLIFDYCFGLTSEERTAQVEALIACNERAADIHARIQAALGPLESLQPEPCPEELAERMCLSSGSRTALERLDLLSSRVSERASMGPG